MDAKAIRESVQALSPSQRKAFLLLVLEHAAAALEVPDRGRNKGYKRAPRFDAILARQWRRLAQPLARAASEPVAPSSSASVAHLFPEDSTARRFAEYLDMSALPEDGTVTDDEMILQLQVSETDQTAAWVFDVATGAVSLLEAEDPHPVHFGNVLRSARGLYAHCGAGAVFADHIDTCMTFARAYAGELEVAAAACSQARERASSVLTPPDE